MLSLKEIPQHGRERRSTSPVCRLLELPIELLVQMLDVLGHDEYKTETLCPLSLVCSQLRGAAQARLFTSINVVVGSRSLRHKETFIEWLSCCPRIRNYVKHVAVHAPFKPAPAAESVDCALLARMLPMLSNLERLWLYSFKADTVLLLKAIPALSRPLHLVIADFSMTGLSSSDINLSEVLSSFESCASVSIAPRHPSQLRSLVSLKDALSNVKCLRALQFLDRNAHPRRYEVIQTAVHELLIEITQTRAWKTLEEFQIDCRLFLLQDAPSSWDSLWLGNEVGENLRRLSVRGSAGTFAQLTILVNSLKNLVSLRFHCYATYGGLQQIPNGSESPFSHLKNLRELELDHVTSQIPLAYIANPNLRRLRVHSSDNMFRRPTELRADKFERSPEEVSTLKTLCPLLEHLELDVGDLSSLWHPTAIVGVDVDVQVYRLLNSLAKLPALTRLRLFPSYLKGDPHRTGWPRPPFCQPLSDEQAIKVFNYLKTQHPSLQSLAISTDNEFASQATTIRELDFHAMSWTMHMLGSQTILVTRQALRDYEQRQVWVGERRLTTEIRRFAHTKPYIEDSPGWMLPPSF